MFGFKHIPGGNVVFIASFMRMSEHRLADRFRSIQAIGAGMTSSLALAIITPYSPQERGKALGMIGMVAPRLATGPSWAVCF